jgi:6-pyruvoyltetrahydropterin/6-carboxytetrahydropterin synthase
MYELTIERRFNATHAIKLPHGIVEPVHGHDWRVVVRVGGEQLDELDLLVDFHELERRVDDLIGPLNHTHLNDHEWFADAWPTAERLAQRLAAALMPTLEEHVDLLAVSITEAPGCTATYRPTGDSPG